MRDKTLRILDTTSDRGLIYKAEQGKAPNVCLFSPAEKEQFITLSKTATTNDSQLDLS